MMTRGPGAYSWLGAVVLILLATARAATASDSQWNLQLNLYHGGVGGLPENTAIMMGVRSGGTDGYDYTLDAKKPQQPPPPYVYLYWDRLGWDSQAEYNSDWRSLIPQGKCKTWHELIATSNLAGTKTLAWTLGVGGTAWAVPSDYTVTLYDEGTVPNPIGGSALNMKTQSSLAFAYTPGETRYFHFRVCHGTPNCGTPELWRHHCVALQSEVHTDGNADPQPDSGRFVLRPVVELRRWRQGAVAGERIGQPCVRLFRHEACDGQHD